MTDASYNRLIVHKFGGSSLGDADRFTRVADILSQHQTRGAEFSACIVVVSAMSGVTNQLIDGALAAAQGNDQFYRKAKADILERHLEKFMV